MHIHFGDGATEGSWIDQAKDALLAVSRTCGKPGSYEVEAEPVPVAKPAAAPTGPQCPEGWKLDANSVN